MFSWIKKKTQEYWSSLASDEPEDQQDTLIGTAPWDIGRPQPAFISLATSQQIRDPVLDVGCGTGENVLYIAGLGFDVTGVDSARAAIETAREKAKRRNVRANFRVVDALDLACLGTTFETVIDSGLFHGSSEASPSNNSFRKWVAPRHASPILCARSKRIPTSIKSVCAPRTSKRILRTRC